MLRVFLIENTCTHVRLKDLCVVGPQKDTQYKITNCMKYTQGFISIAGEFHVHLPFLFQRPSISSFAIMPLHQH